MRIFITGGTGLVGSRLLSRLHQRGDQAVVLTRNVARAQAKLGGATQLVEGDPMTLGPWQDQVSGCDGVVNLAGENLFAKRWNDAFKGFLRDSRLQSTANVVEAIRKAGHKPRVLVNGSAIGYYGYHDDKVFTEESPPGNDFLATLCVDWENAAKPVEGLGEGPGVRLVLLRTGIVLDKTGGPLAKMLLPFKLVLFGGKTASGQQMVSWIHNEDEVGIILFALDNPQAHGPINATAPVPVTNQQLMQAIGQALGRPSFWPTPGFLLKLGLGEVADLVVKGQRVVPKKVQELGYGFRFPELGGALKELLG